MRARSLVCILGLGTCLGAGVGVLAHRLWPDSPVVRGLVIGERRLPDDVPAAAWLAARREQARSRLTRLRFGNRYLDATLGELGVTIDVEATLARAGEIARRGSPLARLKEAWRAREGRVAIPLAWAVDSRLAEQTLEKLAPEVARPAVDAKVDMQNRARIADEPGRELDVPATLAALAAASHDDEESVEVVTKEVPARVRLADLAAVDVDKLLSAAETSFVSWNGGELRAVNIGRAAALIDGTVLAPGEIFSFNDRVGPRTLDRGFVLAPEIQGDELVPGAGGGTCQVSSTLHMASLFGALEIIERKSHSRPSSYTKMGLDATVAYGLVDLKIKNTLATPILIHAFMPTETSVRVELLGSEPIAKVDYRFTAGAADGFVRRITVKKHLPPGTRKRRQKGSNGYHVYSVASVSYFDGGFEERRYYSGYRPVPEVYWVAPDYDHAGLPAPSAQVKGVEVRVGRRKKLIAAKTE